MLVKRQFESNFKQNLNQNLAPLSNYRIEKASTRPSHSHNSCCNIPQVSILLNNKNTETIYVENPIKTADLINKLAKTKQEFMLSSVVKAQPFAIKFYNQIKPMVLQVSIQTNAKL